MNENLFLTNRHYEDDGSFTHRYFYELRGCVAPPSKSLKKDTEQVINKRPVCKSQHQIVLDAARKKVQQRHKRK